MKRREFMTLLGSAAAAWPLAARGQQAGVQVIGLLSSLTANDRARIMAPFQRGLDEAGLVEGRNVAIEYRWAEGRYERLPVLAADLVRRQVADLAALSGTPAALAAKAATTTIPIIFAMGSDPVEMGLVPGLSRPGANITGVTFFTAALGAKRVGLLHELVPKAVTIVLLTNADNPASIADATNARAAAEGIWQQVRTVNVVTGGDIDTAFEKFARERPDVLYVGPDPLFFAERDRLAALATRHTLPTIYGDREIAVAGGLMSYGASMTDAYRQAGSYAGRILKGEKAGDLPVVLPTKFELVINMKVAKALGLEIPPTLLARADEVIE